MKKMMLVLAALAMASSVSAFAAGMTATCSDANDAYRVKVSGGKVMIVSDQSINDGNKTIARFTVANDTLTVKDDGFTFVGDVDLRFNDSNLAGRNVFGTKLGEIDTITLFTMEDSPEATVVVKKRNGQEITVDVTCGG